MKDLTGETFGRLKVLSFDCIKNKRYLWICQCDCGKTISYRSDTLKMGRRKSCGCIKSPYNNEYLDNIKKRLNKNSRIVGNCIEWIGRLNPMGYGLFKIRSHERKGIGFSTGSHRAAYIAWKGEIPEGKLVLHSCDNRRCINPEHLWIGTHEENMQDMMKKERQNKRPGEKHHMNKLCDLDVEDIRKSWNSGLVTQTELAKKYKVSTSCICNIVKIKSWKHLT